MNAPDKCPRCGADIKIMSEGGSWREFRCHTEVSSLEGRSIDIFQSMGCLETERDQLSARVKELEPYEAICKNPAALWANWLRGTVVLPAGIGDVRQEQARVKELEEKLEEWKAYAGRLERYCLGVARRGSAPSASTGSL